MDSKSLSPGGTNAILAKDIPLFGVSMAAVESDVFNLTYCEGHSFKMLVFILNYPVCV